MSAIATMDDIQKMAETIAKSSLFGLSNPTQVAALMLVAQAEGRHPATAAKEYHIINGKPALRADAMLARFQKAGGSVRWTKSSDTEVAGIFSHPQGGELEVRWTAERAAKAQLKSPTWARFPQQMLRARCISEGVRAVFPVVIEGVYAIEEAEDMEQEKQPNAADAIAVADVSAPAVRKSAKEALKEAAEKAAGVKEVEAVPVSPAEEVSDWIDQARDAAAMGATAEELKAKACEKFGGEQFLPSEVKAVLLELWNAQKRTEGGENA